MESEYSLLVAESFRQDIQVKHYFSLPDNTEQTILLTLSIRYNLIVFASSTCFGYSAVSKDNTILKIKMMRLN